VAEEGMDHPPPNTISNTRSRLKKAWIQSKISQKTSYETQMKLKATSGTYNLEERTHQQIHRILNNGGYRKCIHPSTLLETAHLA
jgi:hypothetical protein